MRRKVDIWWREERQNWCADVPTPDGKRKRLNLGPDEQRARAKLHQALARYYESEETETGDSSQSSPYFLSLATQFLEWNEANRTPGTSDMYKYGLKRINKWFPREQLLRLRADEITPTIIEEVKSDLIAKNQSAETINKTVRSIKRLYSWALNQNLVRENPVEGVEKVGRHVNAPEHEERKDMPLETAIQCIELCRESQPLGDICELLLWTGMRIGEAADLRWGDVDLERQMLTLTKHKTSERTGQPRQIPLCSRVVEIIRNQRTGDITPATHVFQGVNGQPFTRSALQCRLRRLRKSHPELKPFHFHRLRHTCATLLARRNVPERVAQAILGHSSKLMTRYYTATDPSEMIDAVERLSSSAESSRS